MEWADVLIPAAIGAAVPTLVALVAAARWSGRLERSVEVVREQTQAIEINLGRVSGEVSHTYEKVRDVEADLRERLAGIEGVLSASRPVIRTITKDVIDLAEEPTPSQDRPD